MCTFLKEHSVKAGLIIVCFTICLISAFIKTESLRLFFLIMLMIIIINTFIRGRGGGGGGGLADVREDVREVVQRNKK